MDFQAWGMLFSNWPTDWFIIGAIAAFIALDALRSGTARAASLILAVPAALLVTDSMAQSFFIGPLTAQFTAPAIQIGIFIGIFMILYIATHRAIFTFSEGGGVIQSLAAGVAATVVLLIVWLQVPMLDTLWHFSDSVQTVFGPAYRFWWLIVAFLALTFARS
jgi:hypothetical protein